ncbi:hypothetical protein F5Y16DRAFT_174138 [Xylariaceae sp. FL0255]|nr:hypothetical protein F5Y16DRAFT_174138 [Xylariaceae sp. FL0255]
MPVSLALRGYILVFSLACGKAAFSRHVGPSRGQLTRRTPTQLIWVVSILSLSLFGQPDVTKMVVALGISKLALYNGERRITSLNMLGKRHTHTKEFGKQGHISFGLQLSWDAPDSVHL